MSNTKKNLESNALKVFAVLFFLCFSALVSACGTDKVDKNDPTAVSNFIKEISPEIQKVDSVKNVTNGTNHLIFVNYDFPSKPTRSMIMKISYAVDKMLEAEAIGENDSLIFFVHMPTVNNAGQSNMNIVAKLTWNGKQVLPLKEIAGKHWNLFNVVEKVELFPALFQDFNSFAQDADNQALYGTFIQKTLTSNK